MLRDWGAEQRYHHDLKGFNYRMDGLQGAVLGVKMAHLEAGPSPPTARRAVRRAAGRHRPCRRLPSRPPTVRHVCHVYAVRTRERDALQAFLARARASAPGIHYPIPVHLQQAFAELGYTAGDFPLAERAANEVLSLPMYPEMTDRPAGRGRRGARRVVSCETERWR